jgi:hypothetical protein
MKHKGRPAYPGPADIQLFGRKLTGNGNGNGKTKDKSKVAEMAEANMSGKEYLRMAAAVKS